MDLQEEQREEAKRRLQRSIDMLERRLAIDSNDLDYETHLRQKRKLQQILDHMRANTYAEKK